MREASWNRVRPRHHVQTAFSGPPGHGADAGSQCLGGSRTSEKGRGLLDRAVKAITESAVSSAKKLSVARCRAKRSGSSLVFFEF